MSYEWVASRRAYCGLVVAQCLGAFNDNAFKMIVSLAATERGLVDGNPFGELALVGAVFVLPYIVFSGWAGALSDRFDKRKVLVVAKGFEVVAVLLGIVALLDGRVGSLVVALGVLGVQAAFFSPAKYALLPEHFAGTSLSRANGGLELGRYLAVIGGSVAGSATYTLAFAAPLVVGGGLLLIALVGAVAAAAIPAKASSTPRTGVPARPLRTVVCNLSALARSPPLLGAVLALTCFEFSATALIFVLLVLGADQLGLSELQAGLLAALAGAGVGVGGLAAGIASRHARDLRVVPLSVLIMGLAVVAISCLGHNLLATATLVTIAGASGGGILVPLNSYLQDAADGGHRGATIAANNFLNMLGVLSASGLLWLLGEFWGLPTVTILLAIGGALLALSPLALCLSRVTAAERLPSIFPLRKGVGTINDVGSLDRPADKGIGVDAGGRGLLDLDLCVNGAEDAAKAHCQLHLRD